MTFFDVTGNIVIGRDGKIAERVIPIADLIGAAALNVEMPLPEGLAVA